MFCPNCGFEAAAGLKFCKRCGEGLAETPQLVWQSPVSRLTGAAWAVALATSLICLAGLGIVFTHAFDLLRPLGPGQSPAGNSTAISIVMIVFGSLTVFGVTAMLLRLFSKLLLAPQAVSSKAPIKKSFVNAPPPQQLSGAPSAVSSVTEHTTRNFESLEERERSRKPGQSVSW